jgi:alanine racemase
MEGTRLQWIELNRNALRHNLDQFRSLIGPDRRLLAMVKANAYGHGMIEISPLVLEMGADWLGVHSVAEGVTLRKLGITAPILVAGYTPHVQLEAAVANDLRLTVTNLETCRHLDSACRRLKKRADIHLKVETGTYRQGVIPESVPDFIRDLEKRPLITLEGISSHFADIEDTTDHSYARYQLENFARVLALFEKQGGRPPLRHMSCSAAAMLFPETYFDMLRVGIGLYGLWPSKETYVSCLQRRRTPLRLEPVLSWKARISQIKKVPKGAFIGYGRTYKTTRETTLALIPIGYSDGYPRSLSNISHILIRAQRAPVRGRVAMNFITADVTDIPGVELEEEVVLIGAMGGDRVSAETLAAWAGTINYEIVARLSPSIPREAI